MGEQQTFIVGEVLPRIAAVAAQEGFYGAVTWKGGPRAGRSDVVDLGPAIMTLKPYAPLRSDPAPFTTVHVINHGVALGWGDDIDMSADGVEELVEQSMTTADFRAFMERHRFTQEAAAARLGISRRQVNYLLTSKAIPRTVALACAYLDRPEEQAAAARGAPIADREAAECRGQGPSADPLRHSVCAPRRAGAPPPPDVRSLMMAAWRAAFC